MTRLVPNRYVRIEVRRNAGVAVRKLFVIVGLLATPFLTGRAYASDPGELPITVSPSTNLPDDTPVVVTGRDFNPDADAPVYVQECMRNVGGCTPEQNLPLDDTRTVASGTYVVTRKITDSNGKTF